MTPTFVLADLYAQSELHRVAYSAMPDAPVLPYVAPKRRLRHLVAALPRRDRRPAVIAFGRNRACRST